MLNCSLFQYLFSKNYFFISNQKLFYIKCVARSRKQFVSSITTSCHFNCRAEEQLLKNDEFHLESQSSSRKVPRTHHEYGQQMKKWPEQPLNPRFLRVAIIGEPNTGKSTLTNQLTGWRVCSVSSKINTTRRNSTAVISIDDTQIEFTDTPGTLNFEESLKHHVENTILNDPEKSSDSADLLAVLVDASNVYSRSCISNNVKKILKKHIHKQSILILNKIDTVKNKTILLEVARCLCNGVIEGKSYGLPNEPLLHKRSLNKKMLFKNMNDSLQEKQRKSLQKGWSHFDKLFMVSALQGEGVTSVLDFLVSKAPERKWQYHPSIVIKEKPQELAKRVIREKLLDALKEEMGYVINIHLESWEVDESDILKIAAVLKCPKNNLVTIVIGPSGKNISALSASIQQELCNVFRCEVKIRLIVQREKPAQNTS